jgi:putative PIN family toxin of toxin-antitoxin system
MAQGEPVIPVVFDCGVLVSAIGWRGNPRRCLGLVAHRQVRLCVTSEIWDEYDRRIPAVLARKRPGVDPRPALDWLLTVGQFVEPAPLRRQRSRDPKDDPYLACALAAGAEAIVTNDRDLLDSGKPFGVSILTPVQFLLRVRGRAGL